jgi:O-antigen ligase
LRLRTFIISLGCAAPLIGSYYIIPRYTLPFDFYDNYFIFILIHLYHLFTPKKSNKILPTWLLKGFSILLLASLIALVNNPGAMSFPFFKQFLGGIFSASSYFIIFKLANFNVYYLFKRYLQFAFLAALLAIIEEFFHMSGIHFKPAFSAPLGLFRVGGLSGEPYNLSLALFPALFFYLMNSFYGLKQIHESNKKAIVTTGVIATAFFLTFSSTGYIGLFLAFLAVAIHRDYFNLSKPRVLLAPLFFAFVYFVFSQLLATNENFDQKVDEGLWFLKTDVESSKQLDGLNSSSFALLSNYQIAMEGFKENPVSGIGLGSYETLFQEKFNLLFGSYFELKYGRQNFNDANSMFLRLVGETGIIGTSLFLFFIVHFFIKRRAMGNLKNFYLIGINHGVFILFVIRLIRCGNYLSDGMFFFVLLFYYTNQFFFTRTKQTPKNGNYSSNLSRSHSVQGQS